MDVDSNCLALNVFTPDDLRTIGTTLPDSDLHEFALQALDTTSSSLSIDGSYFFVKPKEEIHPLIAELFKNRPPLCLELTPTDGVYHVTAVDSKYVPECTYLDNIAIEGRRGRSAIKDAQPRAPEPEVPRPLKPELELTSVAEDTMNSLTVEEAAHNRFVSAILAAGRAIRAFFRRLAEIFREAWLTVRYPGYAANRRAVAANARLATTTVGRLLAHPGKIVTSTGFELPATGHRDAPTIYATYVDGRFYCSDEAFPRIRGTRKPFVNGRAACIFKPSVAVNGDVLRDTEGTPIQFFAAKRGHARKYR